MPETEKVAIQASCVANVDTPITGQTWVDKQSRHTALVEKVADAVVWYTAKAMRGWHPCNLDVWLRAMELQQS